ITDAILVGVVAVLVGAALLHRRFPFVRACTVGSKWEEARGGPRRQQSSAREPDSGSGTPAVAPSLAAAAAMSVRQRIPANATHPPASYARSRAWPPVSASAVTPSTRPPFVTSRSPCRAVPAWKTRAPVRSASATPVIGVPRSVSAG